MCRRSGNLGSKPNKHDPFKRAEVWLRHRKEAKPEDATLWKSLLVSAGSFCSTQCFSALSENVNDDGASAVRA